MRKKISKGLALILSVSMAVSMMAGCSGKTESSGKKEASGDAAKESESAVSAPEEKDEAQAAPEAAPEEILFWHSYSEGEEKIFNEQVLTTFEKKYPDIKVNAVRMPYEGMDQQLITAISGDAAPDVMRMDITWVAQMAKLGALEKVDGKEGFEDIKANALESAMSTNLYKDEYYGLPLNTNTTAAVFNNKLLKEFGFTQPPKTMDELLAAKGKADPLNEKWLFTVQGSYNWAMLPFIWTLGGSLTDEQFTKASGYLNSPETVSALETICKWYKDGIIGPSVLGGQPDSWGGMSGDNYGMIVEGPWYYSSGDESAAGTMPALIPSVDGRSISVIGGENVVMTTACRHKEAAWTFMKFLLEDEQQLAMSKAGMIPTMQSAMSKVDTTDVPYVAVYIEQLKNAKPRTPSAQWPSIEEALNQAFEMALRGDKTAKDALDEAAVKIDELLKEE